MYKREYERPIVETVEFDILERIMSDPTVGGGGGMDFDESVPDEW